ncbi:MAG: hypothetical protein HY912_22315 [Desulfomonile tiedjei]|uniref:Uncharacterized protein n=1 Tax=Desulfomonile tiedjei TaxID=2358 RepID=A0A9D6Z2H8_9BACT|nr:hypothetical protein [Desulfomonile tiedjei]
MTYDKQMAEGISDDKKVEDANCDEANTEGSPSDLSLQGSRVEVTDDLEMEIPLNWTSPESAQSEHESAEPVLNTQTPSLAIESGQGALTGGGHLEVARASGGSVAPFSAPESPMWSESETEAFPKNKCEDGLDSAVQTEGSTSYETLQPNAAQEEFPELPLPSKESGESVCQGEEEGGSTLVPLNFSLIQTTLFAFVTELNERLESVDHYSHVHQGPFKQLLQSIAGLCQPLEVSQRPADSVTQSVRDEVHQMIGQPLEVFRNSCSQIGIPGWPAKAVHEFIFELAEPLAAEQKRFSHLGATQFLLENIQRACEANMSQESGPEGTASTTNLARAVVNELVTKIKTTYPDFAYSEFVPELQDVLTPVIPAQSRFRHFQDWYLRWKDTRERFTERLVELKTQCREIFAQQVWPEFEGLSDEHKNKLGDRKNGLAIILDMLIEVGNIESSSLDPSELSELPEEPKGWADFAAAVAQVKWPDKLAVLRQMAEQNYRKFRDMQALADQEKDLFFSFLKDDFFDIIHNLEDSKMFSQELCEELKSAYPENTTIFGWFGIYDRLIAEMETLLKNFCVTPINPARGDQADFKLISPYGTEPDAKLKTGQVCEPVYRGYQFSDISLLETDTYVVEKARVIVVRN